MHVMVFDIETVPDVAAGRRLYGLDGLNDADTAQAMFQLRREKVGNDFLAHYLQRIVAISVVFQSPGQFRVWSLGEADDSEAELIRRFYDGLERFTPTLVSWNGGGFDLPVLHYRALLHQIAAPRYWETGETDNSFRYNNYLGRFHWRHIDLMDVLAAYQMRANAPLDEIALLLGYPGKLGMSGSKVWEHFQQGDIDGIRNYCETDVLNTYLVYLRFRLLRGELDPRTLSEFEHEVKQFLQQSDKAHFMAFLSAWEGV